MVDKQVKKKNNASSMRVPRPLVCPPFCGGPFLSLFSSQGKKKFLTPAFGCFHFSLQAKKGKKKKRKGGGGDEDLAVNTMATSKAIARMA